MCTASNTDTDTDTNSHKHMFKTVKIDDGGRMRLLQNNDIEFQVGEPCTSR
jgi:hypothetical protein